MPASAGRIVIDISAGTAQFIVEMDAANVKLQQFGQGAQQSGIHLVSSMQASSAAIRLLDNPLGNNIRAVERFITLIPGMGRALQLAFPVIGAIAFLDIVVRMGTELGNFFQKLQDAPAKAAAAFRGLNEPLTISNDELKLANDRKANEILQMQGRQPNTLAIALDEARANADKLAESLDKDLGALQKLLKEQGVGRFMASISNTQPTAGEDEGIGRLRTALAKAKYDADQNAEKAITPEGKQHALLAGELAQRKLISEEIQRQDTIIQTAQRNQDIHLGKNQAPTYQQYLARNVSKTDTSGPLYAPFGAQANTPDQTKELSDHTATRNNLQGALNEADLRIKSAAEDASLAKAREKKKLDEDTARFNITNLDNADKASERTAERQRINLEENLDRQREAAMVGKADAQGRHIPDSGINDNPDALGRQQAIAQLDVQIEQDRVTRLNATDNKRLADYTAFVQAKAVQEKIDKTPLEQQDIDAKAKGQVQDRTAANTNTQLQRMAEVAKLQERAAVDASTANRDAAEKSAGWWQKAYDEIMAAALKTTEFQQKVAAQALNTGSKVSEVQDKGQGELDAKKTEGRKLQLEQTYALQPVHTDEQELAFARQSAALDQQARQDKISGLVREKAEAQGIADNGLAGEEKQTQAAVQVAELEKQIGGLEADDNNANIKAETEILRLKQEQNALQTEIKTVTGTVSRWNELGPGDLAAKAIQPVMQLPGSVGGALSSGIFDSFGKSGTDVGKQVGDALKGAGKEILGEGLTIIMQKMLAEIVINTGLQAVLNSLFPATAAAQTAAHATTIAGQTTALVANADINTGLIVTAIGAGSGASAAGGVAGGGIAAAGSVAGGVAGAAGSPATGLVGPLISAAGGIIGGVISAVATWIGDNKIVKAVDGTTAAVNALGSKLGPAPGLGTGTAYGTTTTTTATTQQPTTLNTLNSLAGVNLPQMMLQMSGLTGGLLPGLGSGGGGILSGIFGGGSQPIPVTVTNSTTTTSQPTAAPTTIANLPGSGTNTGSMPGGNIPILGGLLNSLMGKGSGGQQPVPVDVVSFSPTAPLSGLFHMLGFAEGGRPAPGIPYIVGERGPEVRMDDGPGSVIPNHVLKAFSNHVPMQRAMAGLTLPPLTYPSTSDYMTAGVSSSSSVSSHVGDSYSGNHTFNIYESTSARETAREIAGYIKTASPRNSPFSR